MVLFYHTELGFVLQGFVQVQKTTFSVHVSRRCAGDANDQLHPLPCAGGGSALLRRETRSRRGGR